MNITIHILLLVAVCACVLAALASIPPAPHVLIGLSCMFMAGVCVAVFVASVTGQLK